MNTIHVELNSELWRCHVMQWDIQITPYECYFTVMNVATVCVYEKQAMVLA